MRRKTYKPCAPTSALHVILSAGPDAVIASGRYYEFRPARMLDDDGIYTTAGADCFREYIDGKNVGTCSAGHVAAICSRDGFTVRRPEK